MGATHCSVDALTHAHRDVSMALSELYWGGGNAFRLVE